MISWLIKRILRNHLTVKVKYINNNGLSRNKLVTSVLWDDNVIKQYESYI